MHHFHIQMNMLLLLKVYLKMLLISKCWMLLYQERCTVCNGWKPLRLSQYVRWTVILREELVRDSEAPGSRLFTTLEATQGQLDAFFSHLPYKCHQNWVASVRDWLDICSWVTSRVAWVQNPPHFTPNRKILLQYTPIQTANFGVDGADKNTLQYLVVTSYSLVYMLVGRAARWARLQIRRIVRPSPSTLI